MSQSTDKYLRKAQLHIKAGEGVQAEEIYKKILAKFPKNKKAILAYQKLKTPPQVELNNLISLFNNGKFKETVLLGETLTRQFPSAIILHEIVGAANMGLGNADETIASYQRVLQLNHKHTDAYNNLGMVFYNEGKFSKAVDNYQKAVEIEPNFADAHYNLANALKQTGDLGSAIESYRSSIKINPNDAEVLSHCGNALKDYGEFDQALECYNKALAIDPAQDQIRNNVQEVAKEKAEIDNLISDYGSVIKQGPGSAEISYFTGKLFNARGYSEVALDNFKDAIKAKPDYAEAYNEIGLILKKRGQFADAIKNYKQAVKSKPDYAEAYNNLGNALNNNGDLEAAIESYDQAIKIKPDFAEAHNNIGLYQEYNGCLNSAIKSYQIAININPECAEFHKNIGNAYRDFGDLKRAVKYFQKAIKIKPDFAEAHFNKSLVLLRDEKFELGWSAYKWRWEALKHGKKYISSTKPSWNLDQRQRVLLWPEQGIGDEIMFSSIIPDLQAQCSKLIVQADKRLIPIFKRSFSENIDFWPSNIVVPETEYDAHIPIGSLPLQFRQTTDSFKSMSKGWLSACYGKASRLRKKLVADKVETIIGISWNSTNPKIGARHKIISLTQLAVKLDKPTVKLVNLQYGDVGGELEKLRQETGIKVYQVPEVDNKNDLDGLASLIIACDKIVSISNITIHLAGALGKEAHVLLASSSDWRWGKKCSHSHWYDSVQLLRQTKINDWDTVLEKLKPF